MCSGLYFVAKNVNLFVFSQLYKNRVRLCALFFKRIKNTVR